MCVCAWLYLKKNIGSEKIVSVTFVQLPIIERVEVLYCTKLSSFGENDPFYLDQFEHIALSAAVDTHQIATEKGIARIVSG